MNGHGVGRSTHDDDCRIDDVSKRGLPASVQASLTHTITHSGSATLITRFNFTGFTSAFHSGSALALVM